MRFRVKVLPVLLVLLAGAAVSRGLWSTHMHYGHSAHIDLVRQIEVHQSFQEGIVYPRWISDFYFGRGSPIFNFYAPLVYIAGEFFCFFGLSPLFAVKAMYILLVMLAGLAMYFLTREIWDLPAALACSVLYLLSPYLLVDLYVRSALAELSAFAFLPLAMYFLLREAQSKTTQDAARAAAAVALLCLSHNISALIGLPVLIGWSFFIRDRASLRRILLAIGLGLLMSSFFWGPALLEKKYINAEANLTQGDYHYSRHFVSWAALLDPSWGYGSPMGAPGEIMSTQIGLLHLLCALPALWWLLKRSGKRDRRYRAVLALALTAALGLFFTNSLSRPFWDHLPLMPFVQFPFRFLLIATLGLTGLAGAVCFQAGASFGKRGAWVAALVLILAALILYGPYAEARYLLHDRKNPERVFRLTRSQVNAAYATGNFLTPAELLTPRILREMRESKTTARDDYLPIWVTQKPTSYFSSRLEVLTEGITVELLEETGARYRVGVRAESAGTLLVHTFYFPGWTARVGERTILKIRPQEKSGEILLELPQGEYELVLSYEDTRARFLFKLVSLSATVGMIGWMGTSQYRRIRAGRPSNRSRRRRHRRSKRPRLLRPLRLPGRRPSAPPGEGPDTGR